MKSRKWAALVAAALVGGLVLGNLGSAVAATATRTQQRSVTSEVAACGLGIGRTMRDAGGRMLDVVASLTGKSTTDIQAERAAGKSFAQIAEANGVDSSKVVAKTLAVRKVALDRAVKSGQITQAQADSAYATMKTRLTDRVSNTAAGCNGAGGGMMGGRGNGGGRGMRGGRGAGAGCGGNCGATTATQ